MPPFLNLLSLKHFCGQIRNLSGWTLIRRLLCFYSTPSSLVVTCVRFPGSLCMSVVSKKDDPSSDTSPNDNSLGGMGAGCYRPIEESGGVGIGGHGVCVWWIVYPVTDSWLYVLVKSKDIRRSENSWTRTSEHLVVHTENTCVNNKG